MWTAGRVFMHRADMLCQKHGRAAPAAHLFRSREVRYSALGKWIRHVFLTSVDMTDPSHILTARLQGGGRNFDIQ